MKSLHLAGPEDFDRLLPLVAAFHNEAGFGTDADHIEAAVRPLLEGAPHGAFWLIGPKRAPVGYLCVSFGWSIEFGGLDAMLDEIFIRPAVRGRGMGATALDEIAKALRENGVRAMHLEVERDNQTAQRLYARSRFEPRDRYTLMSRRF